MTRAFLFHDVYAVYIWGESDGRHHRPHAHICKRGMRIATVFLETLDVFDESERVPKEVMEEIRARQDDLVALWIEVNEDE
jgi:hypothetical protein